MIYSYVDRFVWNDPKSQADPAKILRVDSRFLCPNVYSAKDLWHNHTGWFERVNAKTKRLINVNVDFVDSKKNDEIRRAIVIKTVLSDMLNQPGYDRSELEPTAALSLIEDHLDQLHDYCKDILSAIINDEMVARIALKG